MRKLIAAVIIAALAMPAQAVFAQSQPTLTVSEAVSMVMAYSEEFKKNTENVGLNDLQHDSLIDEMATTYDSDTLLSLTIQLMQNEIQASAYSDTTAVFKDKAEYSIEQVFASIISAEKDLALTKENLKISQREYTIAKVKQQVGKLSDLELKNTKLTYEKLEKSIVAKENTISKAYMSLNETMGATLTNRYSLALNVSYAPITVIDLNSSVGVALGESTSVKNLSESMVLADYKYSAYRNDPETSEVDQESLKISADQAQRNYSNTRTDLEASVLTAYRAIIDLEADVATSLLTLEGQKQQLAAKETEFTAGKATELEVDKLKLQIAQQEESIRKLYSDHYLKVKQFKNANLL